MQITARLPGYLYRIRPNPLSMRRGFLPCMHRSTPGQQVCHVTVLQGVKQYVDLLLEFLNPVGEIEVYGLRRGWGRVAFHKLRYVFGSPTLPIKICVFLMVDSKGRQELPAPTSQRQMAYFLVAGD